MDFEYTEAQRDLSGLARDLCAERAWNATGFDPELWRALAAAGLLDAALPESAGGAGFDVLEQCAILIELGRALAPAPYTTGIAVAAATIARFGNEGQVRRWVGPVLSGEATIAPALARGVVAFEAERQGELWRIEGAQQVVAAGAFAGAFLVEARAGADSLLLLVDRDTDGVSVTAQHVVDGRDAALLELRDVVVGPAHALSAPGAAAWARRRATIATCAYQLGVLTRALELTCEYARTRKQFDKPIGAFQAVRQRLADAFIDVEAVRLTLWQAAWRESRGLPADSEIAVAKFWAAEAGHRVAHTAVHVHASTGIYRDYPMQRYFLAAKRAEFESGSAVSQLRGLGMLLAAEPADA
ncbi:acyl-CoA/acyl-ACP dehydrogenase [Nocardia yamanashiensis]|uniref:acyl-CoA dehydrogenase family protein n=1 Tax=Nocardia yamanashiensis TaxID=209247 RepID=UPI001E28F74C|nr:acyl-CoA dehydrogenase family protein [Nocardia yamanashiensis]UGT44722.1 acyl-CoA/acyl-ACP dehydrogenase [Nocardia yamanashiensis]